jgi:hypothetical protein
MFTKIMKFAFPMLTGALLLASCSGMKKVGSINNYDDAYFTQADLQGSSIYASGLRVVESSLETSHSGTQSLGQTYADRMRNFGGSGLHQPTCRVAVVPPMFGMGRCGFGSMSMGFNPYMAYNPMMMGNPWMYGGGFGYNSFGYSPFNNFYNDPYWMYYNQMNNPNMYWGGGWSNSGGGFSGNSGSGNSKPSNGFVNNPKPASGNSGFSNSGPRRSSYQTGLPTSGSTGRSSSWGSSPSSSSSGNWNSGSSSRSSGWSQGSQQGSFNSGGGSSSSRSSSAVQGTSGRRR